MQTFAHTHEPDRMSPCAACYALAEPEPHDYQPNGRDSAGLDPDEWRARHEPEPMHLAAVLTGGSVPAHVPGAYPSLSCCGGPIQLVPAAACCDWYALAHRDTPADAGTSARTCPSHYRPDGSLPTREAAAAYADELNARHRTEPMADDWWSPTVECDAP